MPADSAQTKPAEIVEAEIPSDRPGVGTVTVAAIRPTGPVQIGTTMLEGYGLVNTFRSAFDGRLEPGNHIDVPADKVYEVVRTDPRPVLVRPASDRRQAWQDTAEANERARAHKAESLRSREEREAAAWERQRRRQRRHDALLDRLADLDDERFKAFLAGL